MITAVLGMGLLVGAMGGYTPYPATQIDAKYRLVQILGHVTDLEISCDAMPNCKAFDTSAWLYSCGESSCFVNESISVTYVKGGGGIGEVGPMIWPIPTGPWSNGSDVLSVDASSFSFEQTGSEKSAVVEAATSRLLQRLFRRSPGAKGVLQRVSISITEPNATLQVGVDESYSLSITTSPAPTASITAQTPFGVLHGLATLEQLVAFDAASAQFRIASAPWSIQNDKPAFPWRGLMIDSARHFLPLKSIQRTIDAMALVKLNVLHWHIVDLQSFPFESSAWPRLWEGAFSEWERYSREDVAAVVAFAAARGVVVVPEFDTPGHASSWCKGYPSICPSASCLSPLNPATNETFSVIAGLVAESRSLFNDKFWHAGGDEVDTACWSKTAAVAQWMAEKGFSAEQAYGYFVERVHTLVRAEGMRPLAWEEVWDHFGTQLQKDTIVHVWLHDETTANASAHGYDVVWSLASGFYLTGPHIQLPWTHFYSQDPLRTVDPADAHHVLGAEAAAWGETADASNFEQLVWPRAAAAAEVLWARNHTQPTEKAMWRLLQLRAILNEALALRAGPVTVSPAGGPPGQPGSVLLQ